LDSILKENEVDCVIVSGFATEHCVLFTYNGAKERGYQAYLLQNGVSGINEIDINRIQLLRSVISYEALEYFIK
jgi:nicotinamidase-related amidase